MREPLGICMFFAAWDYFSLSCDGVLFPIKAASAIFAGGVTVVNVNAVRGISAAGLEEKLKDN